GLQPEIPVQSVSPRCLSAGQRRRDAGPGPAPSGSRRHHRDHQFRPVLARGPSDHRGRAPPGLPHHRPVRQQARAGRDRGGLRVDVHHAQWVILSLDRGGARPGRGARPATAGPRRRACRPGSGARRGPSARKRRLPLRRPTRGTDSLRRIIMLAWLYAEGTHHDIGLALGRWGAAACHDRLVGSPAWASVLQWRDSPEVMAMRLYTEQAFPWIIDEIAGLAQGLDLPFDDVFLWNCRGDLWALAPDGCTTVLGPARLSHNEDGDPALAGRCGLAEIRPARAPAFV